MSEERKYFPFYWNWADMINDAYDDGDMEFANLMALGIIRYASRGEIIDFGDKRMQRLFEKCLTVGLDNAEKRYQDGCKGGAPKIQLTADEIIESYSRTKNWEDTAKELGTNAKTLRNIRMEYGIDKKGQIGKSVKKDTDTDTDLFTEINTENQRSISVNRYFGKNQEEEEEEEEKEEKEKALDGFKGWYDDDDFIAAYKAYDGQLCPELIKSLSGDGLVVDQDFLDFHAERLGLK